MRPIDYLDKAVEQYRSRVALVDGTNKYTYGELQTASRQLAAVLIKRGVRFGDRVAVYSRNDPKLLMALWAVMRIGAVWAPINPGRVSDDDNVAYLMELKPRCLIYHGSDSVAVAAWKARLKSLCLCVCLGGAQDDDPSLADLSFEAAPAAADYGDPRGNGAALIGIFQTGGTTGVPKAVMWDATSFGTAIDIHRRCLDYDDRDPVWLQTMPLAHGALCLACVMFTLGATLYVESFATKDVLRRIEQYHATHVLVTPSGLYGMLASPSLSQHDYASLRRLIVGAAGVAPEKLIQAVNAFGPCVTTAYGQMETLAVSWFEPSAIAAYASGGRRDRLRSCGYVTESVRVGIMREDGSMAEPGGSGEIVVRGRSVSPGYFNDPGATARARTAGWHHTGDLGYFDEEGLLYVSGRKRDLIICGGYNVYAADVEARVSELEEVCECAVVGVADEALGEIVGVVIVTKNPHVLSAEEVRRHCEGALGKAAIPRTIEFWDSLPRTMVGKPDKRAIASTLGSRGSGPTGDDASQESVGTRRGQGC